MDKNDARTKITLPLSHLFFRVFRLESYSEMGGFFLCLIYNYSKLKNIFIKSFVVLN